MKISNLLKFKNHSLKSLHKNNYATISRVQNFDVEAFDFIPPPNIPQVVGKYKHPPQFPKEKNPHELLTSSQWCFRQLHLNRPEQGNTLNRSLVDKLRRALRLKEQGNVTKTLLLKGRFTQNAENLLLPRVYDKAFCLGPDWGEIINNRAKGRMDLVHDFFREQYQLSIQTYNFQKPLMALINGAVSSSGAGISFHCGLRLSTATSLFAMPETGFGFVPDCGQTFQMSRLEKNLGTYLALTGRRVVGFDLKHLGLATHHIIIGSENKMGEIVGNAWSGDYQKILHLMEIFECTATPFSLEPHIDIIDNCFGKDTVEEIIEALKGYYSPFATKTLQTLQEKSPLSLKLTLEALRIRNREDLDLRQTMHNEWRAAKRLLDDPQSDLYIGLNATVLSGRSFPQTRPRWNHASVSEVPQSLVESYFQPFGTAEEDDFIDDIQDRPLGELDQILSYLSHHRELLSEHKMPDYLEDVKLTDKQQKDLDSLVLEEEDEQDTLSENIVGDAETFYNAVVANRRFDDFDWNERERTITFECPVEFDFDRQIDKQLLENIFLTAKAESIVTGKPMPDMTDFQAARDQIEESYSNMYLIDDLSDFFDQWGTAEFAMEDEKAKYRDLSKYNQHLSYIQAPQLYLEDHIEGYYFDEAVPIEKKYY